MMRDDHPGPADDLGSREAARTRRRDRDADAQARDLLRPGMGKVFKQIRDAQAKAAKEPVRRRNRALWAERKGRTLSASGGAALEDQAAHPRPGRGAG